MKRFEARLAAFMNHQAARLLPIVQGIPRPLLNFAGPVLGEIAFWLWTRVRKIAIDNLSHAFPEKSPREIRRLARSTFHNWGRFVMETLQLSRYTEADWEKRTIIDGRENFDLAFARGRGVLLVSGHIGCFEMGPARAASVGYPTNVVVRYAKTAELTEKMNAAREMAGYKVFCYDSRGLKTIRALRNNEIVGILFDQNATHKGIFVDFFGRPASTLPGTAIVAARTGAALIPGFVVREPDGRYRIIVEPEVPNPGPDADDAAIHDTIQQLTARLEAIIRRYPDQWLWMHRRWKTQPTP